jgi:DNA-binding beta-propeller fold protein YncE
MGIVPAVVLVDLAEGVVLGSVALPEGSGATGAPFVNDSIVLVTNPDRDTVSPVNVLRRSAGAEIPVGGFPTRAVVVDEKVFVVNGELEDFTPVRDGTLTVLDRATLEPVGSIQLSGRNPGGAVLGPNGLLYVVHGGVWGQGAG